MQRFRPIHGWIATFGLSLTLIIGYATLAQEDDASSADDVISEMSEGMEEGELIEPTYRDPDRQFTPVVPVQVDPNVVGTAPGQPRPELRREGELVVNRRGRLTRSGDGVHSMFVFESDSRDNPEPPMMLMPCQLLQNMEDLVADRGDRIVFIITGQVFTYRGANYMLPTVMKLAIDRGNLEN